ncbi:hypothetical protein [Prosthecomicrobium sp. N25]|uniref:hypothetical protein n=1 Tax=Prosthecomicrobium sp. N25 TaxID=3129254 RepID=UPI00307857BD
MSSENDLGPAVPAPADPGSAVARAAGILRSARFPVVAGLGTDVDGLRAALDLAARLRGAIDHAAGRVLADEMRVFADTGQMNTTPAEARHRADLVLLAGPGAVAYAASVGLFDDAHPLYPWRTERTVLTLAIGGKHPNELGTATTSVMSLDADPTRVDRLAGALRALVAGRALGPLGAAGPSPAELRTAADLLKGCRFGVLVYDPAEFDPLGIEMLQGLAKDLNAATRFTTLPAPPPLGGRIATIVSAWSTGMPLRLGFGRGYPEYDDWRFEAERLVVSGEADALLWVAPLGPPLPAWAPRDRTVALVAPGIAADAAVTIEVGVPGVDHGATLYGAERDGFAFVPAIAPSARPSAAAVLARLAEASALGAAA